MTFWKVEVESYILTSSFLLYKWLSRKLKWSHISCSVPWGHNWSNYIPVVILELQNAETRPSFLSKRSLALSYVIVLEPRQKCYTVGHNSMHRCTGISYYGVVLQKVYYEAGNNWPKKFPAKNICWYWFYVCFCFAGNFFGQLFPAS